MTQRSKEKQQNHDEDNIETNPNLTFFYDTTFNTGMSKSKEWSQIYAFLQQEDFSEEYESNLDDLVDIKASELHKIVVRLTILPYYDMV